MSETFEAPQSRIEAILQNMLGADNEILPPFSRNEVLLIQIAGLLDSIENDKQDKLVSGENIKSINGGSILEAGDLKLEPKWRLIKDVTLTESEEKKYLVFSPTAGSGADTAYIPTEAFQCEKLRVYIYASKSSTVNATISNYVRVADNEGGTNFGDDDTRLFGWTALSNQYDVYSFFDIVTSPYIPTYTEGFAMGRLGTGTVMTKQVSWSATEQNLMQITGIRLELSNANFNWEKGMRFIVFGIDKNN